MPQPKLLITIAVVSAITAAILIRLNNNAAPGGAVAKVLGS